MKGFRYFVKIFLMMLVMLVILGCSSATRSYVEYSDWDSNNDQKINRKEFVGAYLSQGYFKRWGGGAEAISYDELFNESFLSMDADKHGKLSLIEFNAQIRLYYFGLFNDSFDRWDDDSNASVSKNEFFKHVSGSNLASLWDGDRNKSISVTQIVMG